MDSENLSGVPLISCMKKMSGLYVFTRFWISHFFSTARIPFTFQEIIRIIFDDKEQGKIIEKICNYKIILLIILEKIGIYLASFFEVF